MDVVSQGALTQGYGVVDFSMKLPRPAGMWWGVHQGEKSGESINLVHYHLSLDFLFYYRLSKTGLRYQAAHIYNVSKIPEINILCVKTFYIPLNTAFEIPPKETKEKQENKLTEEIWEI